MADVGKATKKQKLGKETSVITVQTSYRRRLSVEPGLIVKRSWLARLFGK